MHLKKIESWSFRTGISVGGWRLPLQKRKRSRNIVQKTCVQVVNGQTKIELTHP